jgi:hypothetical protein
MEQDKKITTKKIVVFGIIVLLIASGISMMSSNNPNSQQTEEEYNVSLMSGDEYTVYCWSDKDQDILWAFKEGVAIPEGYIIKIDMGNISNCSNPTQMLDFEEEDIFNETKEEATTNTVIEVKLNESN